MRYIGGKSLLLENIYAEIKSRHAVSVIDIFAGSGVVSSFLSQQGYQIVSNDLLYFSYVLNRGMLNINKMPTFDRLKVRDALSELNNLTLDTTDIPLDKCFIWANYSPHDSCERMYFQCGNALKIDLIRQTIEKWHKLEIVNDDEYYYLLSRLIHAVPSVSNIAGVYGAYLKSWDPRTYKPLTLTHSDVFYGNPENRVLNKSYDEALLSASADLLYADPPYNSRQYLPNYHILETIARYDYPQIHGKTGMRSYSKCDKSDFCSKDKVSQAFESMIDNAKVKSVVISYSNEGLLPENELETICLNYAAKGTFKKSEIPYRRFKSHNCGNSHVKELLFSFDKC